MQALEYIKDNCKSDFNQFVAIMHVTDEEWVSIWRALVQHKRYEFVKKPCAYTILFEKLAMHLDDICTEDNYETVLTFCVCGNSSIFSDVCEKYGWRKCSEKVTAIATVYNPQFLKYWIQ